jgi:hypothetical protein
MVVAGSVVAIVAGGAVVVTGGAVVVTGGAVVVTGAAAVVAGGTAVVTGDAAVDGSDVAGIVGAGVATGADVAGLVVEFDRGPQAVASSAHPSTAHPKRAVDVWQRRTSVSWLIDLILFPCGHDARSGTQRLEAKGL